ncbi:MAG: carbamoyl phosphate synthase small subunit, partial [Methanothrix sp.]|nr:carbamoyl phosphate synthase small subunit [Euryarchaeota archaeon]
MKAALAVGERADVEGLDVVGLARDQPNISSLDLISTVSCKRPYRIPGDGPRVVMIDLGIKRSILDSMACQGFEIVVVPSDARISEIERYEPDAVFISNGPGDPEQATRAIEAVKHFSGEKPIFGICLGLQVICLALGAETYKLKFGHHGGNQPVKDLASGIVRITSQNHNFALRPESAEGTGLTITQVNANDGTVEGIKSHYLGIEAVQYHPEARPGPLCTKERFFSSVAKKIETRGR